jgi:hypothetical protein
MNPAVALVRAYLELNGYFTVVEQSVVRGEAKGRFREVTDLDALALRFPNAQSVVPRGRPGLADDLRLSLDDTLDVSDDCMDLIIGEIKEGKPKMNHALRSDDVLYTAVARFGCCPGPEIDRVVDDLQRNGEARLRNGVEGIPCRIRLVAFGGGESGRRKDYTVVSMRDVARFVQNHIRNNHRILNPATVRDPVLGLLHLLRKLEAD